MLEFNECVAMLSTRTRSRTETVGMSACTIRATDQGREALGSSVDSAGGVPGGRGEKGANKGGEAEPDAVGPAAAQSRPQELWQFFRWAGRNCLPNTAVIVYSVRIGRCIANLAEDRTDDRANLAFSNGPVGCRAAGAGAAAFGQSSERVGRDRSGSYAYRGRGDVPGDGRRSD